MKRLSNKEKLYLKLQREQNKLNETWREFYISRTQLNYILINLPDPKLVERGIIAPYYKVPIIKENEALACALLPNFNQPEIRTIKFRYSERHRDWLVDNIEELINA